MHKRPIQARGKAKGKSDGKGDGKGKGKGGSGGRDFTVTHKGVAIRGEEAEHPVCPLYFSLRCTEKTSFF